MSPGLPARARARAWAAHLLACVALAACGGDGGVAGGTATVTVAPARTLLVGVGDTASFRAEARGADGALLGATRATWSTADVSVATVDGGGLATATGAGTTTVTAMVDGVAGSASLEVWVPDPPSVYEAGTSYWGRARYVQYVPGELPLVIAAPHGGDLEPDEIPNRTYGVLVTDSNTRETLEAVREAFLEQTGSAPHVVISHLDRVKLDPNREIVEAAQGDPFAEQAWREFHDFVEQAGDAVESRFGSGLFLDLHGHGHPIARAELGYLLRAADLDRSDTGLSAPDLVRRSSVRALVAQTGLTLAELVRGPQSLGALLAERGVRAVPSPAERTPGTDPYFTGGYNTARHGSRDTGAGMSAIQVELPFPGIRDTDASRRLFAARLASAVDAFLRAHYAFSGGGG